MLNSKLKTFKMWCNKVLPLVYDDSLSYYEALCRVVDYLNKVIDGTNGVIEDVDALRKDLAVVEKWIDDYDTAYIENAIKEHLATMIFVEVSDSGYIVYHIPDNWGEITFNTTGKDITTQMQPEYGHLVISY